MSANPERHLRPVEPESEPLVVLNTDTGEQKPLADYLQTFEDHIAGLMRDVRAEHLRYENLKRNRAQEAKHHRLWPEALDIFKQWQRECNHPKSSFTADRFELMLPFLENPKYGPRMCRLAVSGAAFDPFTTRRKNGSTKRHDSIELIFRSGDKFEEFCCRSPRNQPKEKVDEPEHRRADDDRRSSSAQPTLPGTGEGKQDAASSRPDQT